ncbi:MAG TPA: hydrogen peroxide-dependent heme synthase [Chthoniobacterales bacterium]|jgi:chlorite dismutase|nr:hydrogen peroxide-dependent heme synthase [Chthoniobacterales bacterium]
MTDRPALRPKEGWHVLHLFYRVEFGQWQVLTSEERLATKTKLSALVQEIRSLPSTQILTFSIVSPKADVGFMLLTDDLHTANQIEKKLTVSLGPDVLTPVFSFYSLTERSEYTICEEDYAASLVAEKGLSNGTPEFTEAMTEFRQRMQKYLQDRLYPNMPDWPVFCFYPMTKRRDASQNWYVLPFDKRKELMLGHGRIGRQYAGRVRQLITGATGLDDAEWGVTLFANDIFEIKSIVYEMRFDPVSAQYADFGEFYVGLQLPLDDLFRRIQL